LLKEVDIVPQLYYLVLGLLEQFHGGNAGSHICGGGRAGKQIRSGALLEIIDKHLASSDVAANNPKRLRESAHLDIDLAEQAKVMANAPTTQAQHALPMRLIHPDQPPPPLPP